MWLMLVRVGGKAPLVGEREEEREKEKAFLHHISGWVMGVK